MKNFRIKNKLLLGLGIPLLTIALLGVAVQVNLSRLARDAAARVEISGAVTNTGWVLWLGVTLAIAMGIGFGALVAQRICNPINMLRDHMAKVGAGDLDSQCAYDGGDEVGELTSSAQQLVAQLREARAAGSRMSTEQQRAGAELQKDVDSLLVTLRAVAEGDLTQKVANTSDGMVGQIAESFAMLVEQLARSMSAISRNANTLATASEQLNSTAHQMAASSEETSAQAATVSAAAEQVSKSVQTVAAGADEMTASIKEIAKNAHEAAKVATAAVKVAESTTETMTKLGESSTEIGKVIKVITSIAEQTNLLALNATIEAARAGEAGKGFAVVANEVKELAKETAKATEDIGRKIEAIQADTGGAVKAIAEIREIIGRVNDISTTIASAVEEQTATTNEIGRNVGEAAHGTADIAKTITGMAEAAQSTATGATDSQGAASSLSQMASELQSLVGQFRLAPIAGQPVKPRPNSGRANGAAGNLRIA